MEQKYSVIIFKDRGIFEDKIFCSEIFINDDDENDQALIKKLEEIGAKKILNINKKIEVEKAVRNAELTEHISIEDGLELYYKDKTRAKERVKLGKEVIESCMKTMKIEL